MPVTTNNSIYYADGSTVLSIADISAATATSVQNAFDLRQKQSFRWKDLTTRNNQINMAKGDIGYVESNDTEYIYDGSYWKTWSKAQTSYTATITNFNLTSPTVTIANYSISSGVCFVQFISTLATGGALTATFGDISLSLPVACSATTDFVSKQAALSGSIQMRNNAGTSVYGGLVRLHGNDPGYVNILRSAATPVGTYLAVSASTPFTWATAGDSISGAFSYPVV